MTILEMAPYINGDTYTRDCKPPVRCTPQMYTQVVKEAAASDTFSQIISRVDDPKLFMHLEPDVVRVMPVSQREEMFYCLKNGGYSPDVPAKMIYLLKTLYEKYSSVTLALKAINEGTLKVFFQKNYLNECTVRDVVKSMIDPDYEPFTQTRLRISHKDYDEVLVTSSDMVALLPKDISQKLTDNDLANLTVTKQGLSINGLLVRFMAGHYGASNSIYDLRRLV